MSETNPAMATWRRMSVSDVPVLQRIADEVHPGLPEGDHVFTERAKLFPEGCLVLAQGDELCGYAISHPIRRGEPPVLDGLLGEIPSSADQYFIHDIAILPGLRGRGHADNCIRRILDIARRYPLIGLVSVYGTVPFWARFGFVAEPVDEGLSEKLSGYGEDAVYLTRNNG